MSKELSKKADYVEHINGLGIDGLTVSEETNSLVQLKLILGGVEAPAKIKELTDKVKELADAAKAAAELNKKLSDSLEVAESAVPKGAMPLKIDGKTYRIAAKSFKMDGNVYTAEDVRKNKDLQKRLTSRNDDGSMKHHILVEIKERKEA